MRGYWVKILLGALAVFLIGFAGWSAVRSQVNRFRSLRDGSGPITVPLALVPFNLEGQRQGTFRRIRIERDAPEVVSGVYLRVRLAESAPVERLEGCRLAVTEQTTDFDVSRLTFTCLDSTSVDSTLVEFGEIEFDTREGHRFDVPLLLPEKTVAELRSAHPGELAARSAARAQAEDVKLEAERIRAQAESIEAEVRRSVPRSPQQ